MLLIFTIVVASTIAFWYYRHDYNWKIRHDFTPYVLWTFTGLLLVFVIPGLAVNVTNPGKVSESSVDSYLALPSGNTMVTANGNTFEISDWDISNNCEEPTLQMVERITSIWVVPFDVAGDSRYLCL